MKLVPIDSITAYPGNPRLAAPSVSLRPEETDMDLFNLPAFDISHKTNEQQEFC